MSKWRQLVPATALLLLLCACGAQEHLTRLVGLSDDLSIYNGPTYPATTTIAVAFQPEQVGRACRVFAQSLAEFPAGVTGKQVESAILGEAGKRGAEQVLIGRSRQLKDDNGLRFLYFGPTSEYLCADQCGGWKYGYAYWEKQGEWISLGSSEWGKTGALFETPFLTQVIMLRCR